MYSGIGVQLCTQKASSAWGESALISFRDDMALLHLDLTSNDLLRKIQMAGRKLAGQGIKTLYLDGDHWDLDRRWAFFQGYRTAKGDECLHWGEVNAEQMRELDDLKRVTDWVREMINGTPDLIYPETLARESAKLLQSIAHERICYRLIEGDALLDEGYHGIHTVGRGSERQPCMLELDYNPLDDERAPVAACLVGKGITFDSGGYSMKSSENMLVMRTDMGGAATVTGALALAILRGLNKRVKLLLCCAENLVSGQSYKLGDIISYKNGTTVEVLNTDAEGRLVLADGLLAASETGAPLIIDAATLTGAAKTALGRDYNALLSLDDALLNQVVQAARQEHELVWPLPLEPWHGERLSSTYADIANVATGEGNAGASIGAAFLHKFVRDDARWLHVDLSGCFQKSSDELWASGAKGNGVRMLARTLLEIC